VKTCPNEVPGRGGGVEGERGILLKTLKYNPQTKRANYAAQKGGGKIKVAVKKANFPGVAKQKGQGRGEFCKHSNEG